MASPLPLSLSTSLSTPVGARHASPQAQSIPTAMPMPIAMHGAENFFLIYDCRRQPGAALPQTRAQAEALIGGQRCDQLIFLLPPEGKGDLYLITFNRDGSEAELCGNGARCVAALLLPEREAKRVLRMESKGGMIEAWRQGGEVWVSLGAAKLTRGPELPQSTPGLQVWYAVNIGNPHAIFLSAPQVEAGAEGDSLWAGLEALAKKLIRDPAFTEIFPEGANISLLRPCSRTRLQMQTYERGVGLTRACGSAAAAGFAAAKAENLCGDEAEIEMPGGILPVRQGEKGAILLSGPTALLAS